MRGASHGVQHPPYIINPSFRGNKRCQLYSNLYIIKGKYASYTKPERVMAIDMEKLSGGMPRQRSSSHSINDYLRLVLLLWIHPCLLDILDYKAGGGVFRRNGWQYKPLSMWGILDLLEASRCKTSSKLCLILGFCMCKITTLLQTYMSESSKKLHRKYSIQYV